MAKYFKITNVCETENDQNNSQADYFFTTIDYIPKYYYHGIYLREIFLSEDKDNGLISYPNNDRYCAKKIIFGEKYSLCNPNTYSKFGLNMEYNIYLVDHASEHGNIDFLNQWKENKWNLQYSSDSINLASQNGHINVLDWWITSGFKMKYTIHAIDWACEKGHDKILDWWKKSQLEMKYSYNAIVLAIKNNHQNIIEWWKNNIIINKKTTIINVMNWFVDNIAVIILNLLFMVILLFHNIF